jgi:glutathione gamma-glutamylcysteinyltransferase
MSAIPSGIFHRRPLPTTCIPLASPQGQQLFVRAIAASASTPQPPTNPGYVLNLLSQFRTQDEPSYCGISTLVMCLNTLSVDPQQTWKGVWRWWSEELLNCCISLEDAKKTGITLDEFVCLAKCQGISTSVVRPPSLLSTTETTTQTSCTEQLERFRNTVIHITRTDIASTGVLVCSYNRKTLGQTGSGHFSPIGAYDPQTDHVLILDVARFKYPPHWVKLETLFESMRTHDSSTGLPRGYCVLQQSPQVPTLVEAPSIRFNSCLATFITNVQKVLNTFTAEEWSKKNKHDQLAMLKDDSMLATHVTALLDGSCCGLDSILVLVQARNNVHVTCGSNDGDDGDGDGGGGGGSNEETGQRTNEAVNSLRGRILTLLRESDVYVSVMGYLEGKGYSVVMDSEGVDEVERLTLLLLAVAPAIKTLQGTALGNEVLMLKTQLFAIHEGIIITNGKGEERHQGTTEDSNESSACCPSTSTKV